HYDPADPPGHSSVPVNSPPTNPCGPVGAALAHFMFVTVGWSSLLVVAGLASVDLLLFARRTIPDRWGPVGGFGLVLAVSAALVQKFAPGLEPGHVVGSGGYLGALEVAFFEGQFGLLGMLLILAAAGVVGLSLCYETMVALPVREVASLLAR